MKPKPFDDINNELSTKINALPIEDIQLILEFLDARDILRFSQTKKLYYMMIDELPLVKLKISDAAISRIVTSSRKNHATILRDIAKVGNFKLFSLLSIHPTLPHFRDIKNIDSILFSQNDSRFKDVHGNFHRESWVNYIDFINNKAMIANLVKFFTKETEDLSNKSDLIKILLKWTCISNSVEALEYLEQQCSIDDENNNNSSETFNSLLKSELLMDKVIYHLQPQLSERGELTSLKLATLFLCCDMMDDLIFKRGLDFDIQSLSSIFQHLIFSKLNELHRNDDERISAIEKFFKLLDKIIQHDTQNKGTILALMKDHIDNVSRILCTKFSKVLNIDYHLASDLINKYTDTTSIAFNPNIEFDLRYQRAMRLAVRAAMMVVALSLALALIMALVARKRAEMRTNSLLVGLSLIVGSFAVFTVVYLLSHSLSFRRMVKNLLAGSQNRSYISGEPDVENQLEMAERSNLNDPKVLFENKISLKDNHEEKTELETSDQNEAYKNVQAYLKQGASGSNLKLDSAENLDDDETPLLNKHQEKHSAENEMKNILNKEAYSFQMLSSKNNNNNNNTNAITTKPEESIVYNKV